MYPNKSLGTISPVCWEYYILLFTCSYNLFDFGKFSLSSIVLIVTDMTFSLIRSFVITKLCTRRLNIHIFDFGLDIKKGKKEKGDGSYV